MKLLRWLGMLLMTVGLFVWVLAGDGKRGPEPVVHIYSAEAWRQQDGFCHVRMTFATESFCGQRDLTVYCGEESRRLPLNGENAGEVHTLEFLVAEQPEEIRAALDGAGEAAAPVDGERQLVVRASAGAVFQLQLVAPLWKVLSCPEEIAAEAEREVLISDSPRVTLTADGTGRAYLNLTRSGLPDGLYLLTGEGQARYVCVPEVDASGELLGSTVTLPVGE